MKNLSKSIVFVCALSSCIGPIPPLNRTSSHSRTPLIEAPLNSNSTYRPCGIQGSLVLSGIDQNLTLLQISQRLTIPVPDVMISACCLLRNNLLRSDSLVPVCGL